MKNQIVMPPYKRHRIIIPVYIPQEQGYFGRLLEVFRISFLSLLTTIDSSHTAITIINNNSIDAVDQMVMKAFREGKIDRYIRHQFNRGKPDPVAAEIMASYESLVTVADCDVMFMHGWQLAVERIFEGFSGVGAVSPAPAPKIQFHMSSTAWIDSLITGRIRANRYVSDLDLDRFANSVGRSDFYKEEERKVQFSRVCGKTTALLGAGHFVITFRRSAFNLFIYKPKLSGTGAGIKEIDRHVDRAGYSRYSTTSAYVLHLGNVPEPWMADMASEIVASSAIPCLENLELLGNWGFHRSFAAWFPYRLRLLFMRLIEPFFRVLRRKLAKKWRNTHCS